MIKIFRVTILSTGVAKEVWVGSPQKEGWNDLVRGWSIGGLSSGADLQIDEDLTGSDLGIFPVSNHVMLWGRLIPGRPLPGIALFVNGVWWEEPILGNADKIEFRFDRHPLRIGDHMVELES